VEEREFWMAMRHALLIALDAIEKRVGIARTAELRKSQQ